MESASQVVTSHPNKVGGLTRGKKKEQVCIDDEMDRCGESAATMTAIAAVQDICWWYGAAVQQPPLIFSALE